jgi:hypothetical protein
VFLTLVKGTPLGKISVSVRFRILILMMMKILNFWNVASSRLEVSVQFSASVLLTDIVRNIMTLRSPEMPATSYRGTRRKVQKGCRLVNSNIVCLLNLVTEVWILLT